MPLRTPLVLALVAGSALAQQNSVSGTDVFLYDLGNATIYGRRGPAYPNAATASMTTAWTARTKGS